MEIKKEKWTNSAGVSLACYAWEIENPKFLVFIAHGYAEHACRYDKIAREFNSIDGYVFAHDHWGHGDSGPLPAESRLRYDVQDLDQTAKDINDRIRCLREKFEQLPVLLYGHSMGGLLSLMAAISMPSNIDGLILEAAAIKLHPASAAWWQIAGAKVLNRVLPSLKVGKLELEKVSRNADTVQSIKDDVHCADRGGATAGFAVRMLNAQKQVLNAVSSLKCPTLIASGTDDLLTCKTGSDLLSDKMENSQYKVYNGAYHQLHAELDEVTQQFTIDVKEWTNQYFLN